MSVVSGETTKYSKEVMVNGWCSIDNLTQDDSWKEILEKLKEELKQEGVETILLDFKGINVVEPWILDTFCEILKMENVYFRFTSYNKESLDTFVNKIKMRCIMEGLKADRVETIFIPPVVRKTAQEIQIEKDGEEFIEKFVVDGDKAYIEMDKIYSQIGSISTVEAIVYAVRGLAERQGIKDFVIKTGKMFIQSNMLKLLANYIIQLNIELGVDVNVDTDILEHAKDLNLHIHTASSEQYTTFNKLKEFLTIKEGTPGLLVKYKKSTAVDEFGRKGKGQVILNRISVFRGLIKRTSYSEPTALGEVKQYCARGVVTQDGYVSLSDIYVVVDTYNNAKFVTHAEWLTRNDGKIEDDNGREIKELPCDRIITPIDNIGLMDKFLGLEYHFSKAVQKSLNDSKSIIVDINDEGNCVSKVVTIPERIEIVLDDWDVEYNKEELDNAKELTATILNGLEKVEAEKAEKETGAESSNTAE